MLLVVRYTLVQHWFESTMKDKKSMLPTAPPPFSSSSCWKLEVSQRQRKKVSQESTHFHITSNLFGPLWRKKSVSFWSTISATTSHVVMIWASPRVHPFPYNFKLICSSLEEEDFIYLFIYLFFGSTILQLLTSNSKKIKIHLEF
jgi:hypothetical protein